VFQNLIVDDRISSIVVSLFEQIQDRSVQTKLALNIDEQGLDQARILTPQG